MSKEVFEPLLAIVFVLTIMLLVTLAAIAWSYNDSITIFKCAVTAIIYTAYVRKAWRKYR